MAWKGHERPNTNPSSKPLTRRTQTAASGISAVERSMARRERISTVLRRAQLLHLEKRTEHAWRLHLAEPRPMDGWALLDGARVWDWDLV